MNALVERLCNHPESAKHLFWFKDVSDEYLEKLYATSTCLIAASEGEGFGLPLIEAAQHKVPIIARDIPVFREVAGENAYFFKGLKPENLVQVIKEWLILYKQGVVPDSNEIEWLTWSESAQQLLNKIFAGR
jgi:glycosyltransferase involved in cell wall biosynthesis